MKLQAYVVEDDLYMQQTLVELLHASGDVEVVGCSATENEALTWLVSNPQQWSLLIIDYRLAQGNGLRVLSACRVRAPTQRAVMLTAYADAAMRRRCADLGADGVFDKVQGFEPLLKRCQQWRVQVESMSNAPGMPSTPPQVRTSSAH